MAAKLLIIAAVHGQEPQSAFLLEQLLTGFEDKEEACLKTYVSENKNIIAIPHFNEYGLEHKTRGNENKVDLNRNLPAKNWSSEFNHEDYHPGSEPGSEKQTKAFVELIKSFQPGLIISIHTNHFVTVEHEPQVNFDGEAQGQGYNWASKLADLIDLPLSFDIGYATPGSLGSYAKDLKIPCITLELDDKLSNDETEKRYLPALKDFVFNAF